MRVLPYVVVIVVAVAVIVVVAVYGGRMIRTNSTRRRERRAATHLRRVRRETPWTPYCRPDETGVWHYGVERMGALDDRSVELNAPHGMGTLPPGFDEVQRLTVEGDALIEAGRRNAARVDMR